MRIVIGLALGGTVVLTACGGSGGGTANVNPTPNPTPAPVTTIGTAANSNGTYSVTQNNVTTTLPVTNFTLNGQPAWAGTQGFRANAYESANVLAIGGLDGNGDLFAGITGTLTNNLPSGTANYSGRYSLTTAGQTITSAPLDLSADFTTGTIQDVGNNTIDVSGTISGSSISGTVTYNGSNSTLSGGFYGTNEVAGAFDGSNFAGILYGIEQP